MSVYSGETYPRTADKVLGMQSSMKRGRKRDPNRPLSPLEKLRAAKGVTLDEVAAALNTSRSVVHKYEMQPDRIDWGWARRFGRYYDMDPADLMYAGGRPKVPVVGYIGAGTEVLPIDDFPKGEGLDEVPCPPGMNPERTVAAIVRGTSMEPLISDGWRIYYSRDPEQDVSGVVGKLCVVKISDGPTMLKNVRRGPTPGRFNLQSSNAATIEDALLDWASPVRHMQAPD